MRRSLSDTLIELAAALHPSPGIARWLRVNKLHLDLPLDIELKRSMDEWTFVADVPRWRWRTPFDLIPSRIRITWQEIPTDE